MKHLIPPPPLEINEGFEPGKTYVPDKQITYHAVMDLVQASNRFNDQYLELADLIFDEYKKVCDASEYDVSPEMAVVGKFLKNMRKERQHQ